MKLQRAFVVLVLLVAGSWAVWPTVGTVTAQDETVPTAALVEGSCDNAGDVVADLNDLRIRDEGDVLASFTTVELALDDILGSEHALVVSDGGETVSCGNFAGSGSDVYAGIVATTDAGWGGIAWLHARDAGTQVTLFIARGFGGGGTPPVEQTPDDPEPPEDNTPTPPDNETPEANATRTPRPNPTATPGTPDNAETYVSPSYGYSLSYDPAVWEKLDEISQPGSSGSLDVLSLGSRNSLLSLVGEAGSPGFDAVALCDARLNQHSSDPQVTGLTVLEATSGDASHATVVFEYTFNTDDGKAYDWRNWIDCYRAPDDSVLLSFIFSSVLNAADGEAQLRDATLAGLTFPGE